MNDTPGSRKTDRVSATNWLSGQDLIQAVTGLKHSYYALRPIVGTPGSHEREIFDTAARGFAARVDYILDSLDRIVEGKP
jgi:hypothetical protein